MTRTGSAGRGVRKLWILTLGVLVLAAGWPAGARALTIGGEEIVELYFGGLSLAQQLPVASQDGVRGFDPGDVANAGLSASLFADLDDPVFQTLTVGDPGSGLDLEVLLPVDVTLVNHPQGEDPPQSPSFADPFVADSLWTVTNNTLGELSDVVLAFTMVDPLGLYPDVPVALDANFFEILALTKNQATTLYGGVVLPTLAPGASTLVSVRYVVAGDLLEEPDRFVMPPLGLAAVVIPEPTTVVLVAAGLLGLGWMRRR